MTLETRLNALEKSTAEQIKSLRSELAAMKGDGVWRPNPKEDYFSVDAYGSIVECTNHNQHWLKEHTDIGNCFRTREQAELHVRNLRTHQRLKEMAGEWGWKPGDVCEVIAWDCTLNTAVTMPMKHYATIGIRFRPGTARAAIDAIGIEDLKAYLIGTADMARSTTVNIGTSPPTGCPCLTPADQIDALIAAGEKATQGEWLYRPFEYDDWGTVRTTDREVVAVSRRGSKDPKSLDDHRRDRTDPYAPNGLFIAIAANSRSAIKAMRDRTVTLEAENARLTEIEEDHQQHIQFWANAAGDEAVYKASWIRAYKKLEAENAALQARVDGAREMARFYVGQGYFGLRATEWLAQDEQRGKG